MAKAQNKTAVEITWHNEAQTLEVHPLQNADVPEAVAQIVRVDCLAGRTNPPKGRPGWRVKAMIGADEWIGNNVEAAVKEAIKAKFGTDKYHDVKAAVSRFELPDMSDAKADASDWTKFDNAETLKAERDAAGEAATVFFRGEADMRKGLRELSLHIAAVAESLENNKAFKAWVSSGSADLQKALSNTNAKAEWMFVGRLPEDWYNAQPETTNSPKSYQRQWNIAKNTLAERVAETVWMGKRKKNPDAATLQKLLKESLDADRGWTEENKLSDAPTPQQMVARAFYDWISEHSENWSVMFMSDGENGVEPAKDKEGAYIVPTQFGTGQRAHEFVLAVIKAVAAATPEAKAEAKTETENRKAAEAVNPRKFADYGVTEAAMHLARILSSREDWIEVFDAMAGMADRAEKENWATVLADVQQGIDAAQAEAEKAEAEESADDDA